VLLGWLSQSIQLPSGFGEEPGVRIFPVRVGFAG